MLLANVKGEIYIHFIPKCSKYSFRLLSASRLGLGRQRRDWECAGKPQLSRPAKLNREFKAKSMHISLLVVMGLAKCTLSLYTGSQPELNSDWWSLFHWWVWISKKIICLLFIPQIHTLRFLLPAWIHCQTYLQRMAQSHCLSKAAALEGLCRLHEETLASSSKCVFVEVSRYIFSTARALEQPWLALALYMC